MAATRPTPIQFPTRRRGLPLNQQTLTVGGLALVAIVLAALIARDFVFPPSTNTAASIRTATVALGTVRSAVTATGTLVPAQQLNVGFKTAGTLTEVDVRVGDKVTAGQILAKLDPTQLQLALDQANASLEAAQANLANAENGTGLVQAQHQLAQAQTNYQNALNNLNADTNTLNADQNTLNADSGNFFYGQYQQAVPALQNAVNVAIAIFRGAGCTTPTPGTCATDFAAVATAQSDLGNLQSGLGGFSASAPAPYTSMPAGQVAQMASAYKTVQADQGRVSADQGKINGDNAQVQSAAFQVTSAQDSYNSQAANRPGQIASAQAQVAGAQAQVNTAQANFNSAVLTAPSDGVIGSVNGGPGDSISATATTAVAQAPGSTAPLPSTSSASGTGSSGGGGSSAFITLLNTNAYEAVVTFAESDAAKLQNGQAGSVTFDALPNVTIPVHVLAIAPAATVVSNVVNYYATLTLDSLNSALKAGLTANATVVTSQASNVLTVPNSAVTRFGQNAFVTVLGANGVQTRVPVQVGVQGDTTTQVTSGLQAGDKVVLPQLRTGTTSGTTRGAGGLGGGGLGGGGVIGGGRGGG